MWRRLLKKKYQCNICKCWNAWLPSICDFTQTLIGLETACYAAATSTVTPHTQEEQTEQTSIFWMIDKCLKVILSRMCVVDTASPPGTPETACHMPVVSTPNNKQTFLGFFNLPISCPITVILHSPWVFGMNGNDCSVLPTFKAKQTRDCHSLNQIFKSLFVWVTTNDPSLQLFAILTKDETDWKSGSEPCTTY